MRGSALLSSHSCLDSGDLMGYLEIEPKLAPSKQVTAPLFSLQPFSFTCPSGSQEPAALEGGSWQSWFILNPAVTCLFGPCAEGLIAGDLTPILCFGVVSLALITVLEDLGL